MLTTFKTSLWRAIHLTDLKFRRQHLPLSTRLMSFLSAPFEEIEQLTPNPSLHVTALDWAYVGQNIYSSCLSALLRESGAATPASPNS